MTKYTNKVKKLLAAAKEAEDLLSNIYWAADLHPALAELRRAIQEVSEHVHIIYECGICSQWHPWDWDGDCRDNDNRYASPEKYMEEHRIEDVEVRTMGERLLADGYYKSRKEMEADRP